MLDTSMLVLDRMIQLGYRGGKGPSHCVLARGVSLATRDHEKRAYINDCYRVSWQTWRSVCRQRIKNLVFLRDTNWRAIY